MANNSLKQTSALLDVENNLNCDASKAAIDGNIVWQMGKVANSDRVRLLKQDAATIWLTGLSGAGKSTLAFELERSLIASGYACFVLDGDNVRHGLNRDLGFSPEDRGENIRRIAEVAKLFNDAGLMVISAFISPYQRDREIAREIIGEERFVETYVATTIEVCEQRDAKGLYAKARSGEIQNFTGVSMPYEAPVAPRLTLDTNALTIGESIARIRAAISSRLL